MVQGKKILFDPFISGNPLAAAIDINCIKPDYILISHGHQDHTADALAIAICHAHHRGAQTLAKILARS